MIIKEDMAVYALSSSWITNGLFRFGCVERKGRKRTR